MASPLVRSIALGVFAVVAFACSAKNGASSDRLCTPGAYVYCRCQNRDEGTKLCNDDGAGFQACLPCDGTAAVGGGGSDGIGGHGGHSSPPDPPTTSSGHDASTPPAGTHDGGGVAAPADGGAVVDPHPGPAGTKPIPAHCVPLENSAPRVTVQQVADEWPTPVAGTIKDGVYVQTWAITYTGADGDQGALDTTVSQQTIEIKGDVGRFVFGDEAHDNMTGGFRITLADGQATIAYECPAAAPKTFRYDAIGDDLAIYDTNLARFFTRQTGGQP
jgi:hypothetical protein